MRIFCYRVPASEAPPSTPNPTPRPPTPDQARIAIAMGGLTGVGPGKSVQRDFLPAPYNDFILAIIAEEYGLVGAFVVLFVFVVALPAASYFGKFGPRPPYRYDRLAQGAGYFVGAALLLLAPLELLGKRFLGPHRRCAAVRAAPWSLSP